MQRGQLPARRQESQLRQAQQPFDRLRDGTKAVTQFLAEVFKPLQPANARQAAINFNLLFLARHIITRQNSRPGQIDGHFEVRLDGHVLQAAHRIFQKMAIQLVADGSNMPALLNAENIAGPPDFQVAHGNLEARPELGELFNRLEATAGIRRDGAIAVEHEVGIGAMFITANPAAKLMQIGQAIIIRLIDKNGVGVGNIEAAFDDRGRHQNIDLAADELGHGFFKLMFAHLAMADGDPCLGHDALQRGGDFADIVDTVVDEINLALPVELTQKGMADELPVEANDARFDGEASLRRRLQVADVADAQQR